MNAYTNKCEIFNISDKKSSSIASLNVPVNCARAILFNQKFVLKIGGTIYTKNKEKIAAAGIYIL